MLSKLIRRRFLFNEQNHLSRSFQSLKRGFASSSFDFRLGSRGEDKSVRFHSLGNGTYGTPRSIYLDIDGTHRILFNCGEGTVKSLKEHRLKIPEISSIYFTHTSWANLGGLPDLLYSVEKNEMQLWGPPGVEGILRPFCKDGIFASTVVIEKKEYNEASENPEVDFSITNIPLSRSCTRLTKSSQNFTEDRDIGLAFIFKKNHHLPFASGSEEIPHYQNLTTCHRTNMPDGRMVEPKDSALLYQPLTVVVLECPNQDYLDSLFMAPGFSGYQIDNVNDSIDAIIHLTPSSVMQHTKYKQWIRRFPPCTKHVIMNDSFNGCYERKMHRLQQRLHAFEPFLFPLLSKIEKSSEQKPDISNEIFLMPSKVLMITPEKERNICEIRDSLPDYERTKFDGNYDDLLSEWKKQRLSLPSVISNAAQYPEVIFLGTSSKISSAVRNVPSILLHLSKDQCMLLDCGEGTYNQLINLYGVAEANCVLEKLIAVFISHNHADHRMGLETVFLQRQKISEKKLLRPLNMIVPKQIKHQMSHFIKSLEISRKNYRFIPFFGITYGQKNDVRILMTEIPTISRLNVVPVKHCPDAHGIILTHCNGFKLVYSGDTAHCEELISAGQNCDLLIHEATYTDRRRDLARRTHHCTLSQAIDVSQKMKANYTILTHFGRTLFKDDSLLRVVDKQVAIATDFMRVTPQVLHLLPLVSQIAFKACFLRFLAKR